MATGIFAFIQAWNEFIFALVIMNRPENQTLPVWLQAFNDGARGTDWGGVMAGSTLITDPGHRLLPARPPPGRRRAHRRRGEGMSGDRADAAAGGTLLASFPGPSVPAWLLRRVEDGLGGVCLFGVNRRRRRRRRRGRCSHGARPTVVVAIDEEGGDVTRLEAATGQLGARQRRPRRRRRRRADARRSPPRSAASCAAVGVDLDLAPCADVNSDPANPVIGVRSFGADPALVGPPRRRVRRRPAGGRRRRLRQALPRATAPRVDSHLDAARRRRPAEVLRARELVPFRAADRGRRRPR